MYPVRLNVQWLEGTATAYGPLSPSEEVAPKYSVKYNMTTLTKPSADEYHTCYALRALRSGFEMSNEAGNARLPASTRAFSFGRPHAEAGEAVTSRAFSSPTFLATSFSQSLIIIVTSSSAA